MTRKFSDSASEVVHVSPPKHILTAGLDDFTSVFLPNLCIIIPRSWDRRGHGFGLETENWSRTVCYSWSWQLGSP